MMEVFIPEEYVNKRWEQRQQKQQRRRRHTRALHVETEEAAKLMKLPPSASAAAGPHSPRDQDQAVVVFKPAAGSPTADAASFQDHLFDYL